MEDSVECHSSHTYAEQPVAVHWEGERLEIAEIEKSWQSPRGKHFQVRTKGSQVFELFYSQSDDQWSIFPR
jgi:hypothetical protein